MKISVMCMDLKLRCGPYRLQLWDYAVVHVNKSISYCKVHVVHGDIERDIGPADGIFIISMLL